MHIFIKITIHLILLICLATSNILAQTETYADSKLNNELIFSVAGHSAGMALGVDYGIVKQARFTHLLRFEVVSLRHHREVKQQGSGAVSGPFTNASHSYSFGKQNSFYGIHVGYGGKLYFSGKARKQGIAVGFSYAIGPSLGITKPYYLDLKVLDGVVSQSYSEENRSCFLNPACVRGATGFLSGFGELGIVPGGFAKVGLNFDWGAYNHFVKALEMGVMLDVYTKAVPIMLTEDNKAIFPTVYVALQLGKRW